MRALLLSLGADRYALPLERVLEVAGGLRVTALPHAPPEVAGIANLRGAILPVLDAGVLVGVRSSRTPSHVVVVETPRGRVGLGVDALPETVRLGRSLGVAKDERATAIHELDEGSVAVLLDTDALAVTAR